MHSVSTRFQSVFGFLTTVALVLGAIIAASDFLHPAEPTTSIKVSNVQVYVKPMVYPAGGIPLVIF